MNRMVRTVFACALLLALVGPAAASASADAADVAKAHVRANSASFGVTSADVAELGVTSAYRSSHSGVTHVNVNQRYESLEVFGAHATVNVANGGVVFAGGSLERGLQVASDSVRLGATDAVEAAAEALDLDEPEGLRVLRASLAGAHETVLSDGGISEAPIPARLGWQPTKDGLRLAWQVEIDDASDVNYWNATVDARTGALLEVQDLTIEDEYEELAATLVRKGDSPGSSVYPAPDARSDAPVNDGSSYRVFEITKESPNDGPRTLVQNPADGASSPYGWHDTNGVEGAEFTTTRGNNAHAYLDQDSNNVPDFGQDVDGGSSLTFDFEADLTEHAQHYRNAVVTNLFYWNNIVHDVTYRYGFDEVSGNFQAKNYRGGPTAGNGEGDYVRAEAADGGGTNNANFNTGASRMQMFLWPGAQLGAQNQIVVGETTVQAGWARFGPPAVNAGVAGPLAVAANNGCNASDYPAATGFVAITVNVTTGTGSCSNVARTATAQAAGASAVIIASTSGTGTGAGPVLTGAQTAAPVGIPAVSVTLESGNALRALAGETAIVRKAPSHPGIRDGDFESGIIIHEYGHGVSTRLTGGPNVSCLGGNEQAGEGWSDYLAISMLLDPRVDDPEGPRGMGPYALFQASRQGNGIRPRPYSRNMSIQPFTYDSIKTGGWLPNAAGTAGTSLALPHGIGHGWAATLWDITWDLIDKHGFNPNVYGAWGTGGNNRAIQYVMDGLKLQGCNPTLLTSARAVIAAANVLGGGSTGEVAGDACTVYAGFARRGFGYSAVAGTTSRDDNTEAFDTHPDCRRGFLAPVSPTYGTLTTVVAGDTVPLKFTGAGLSGLDILAKNNPYSRLVDCETLRTVDTSYPFVTPRPIPVRTETPGNSGLTVSATGQYRYNWKTLEEWSGTCREVVVTRKDGKQHRAFFRFVAA